MVRVKRARPAVPTGIVLHCGSAVTIAGQLEEQLTWLIATGGLAPGERLPSIRDLGAELGIHHHTVRQAILELDARELITIRRGAPATVRAFTGLWQARPRYAGAMRAQGVLIAAYTPFYLPFLRGTERGAAEAGMLHDRRRHRRQRRAVDAADAAVRDGGGPRHHRGVVGTARPR